MWKEEMFIPYRHTEEYGTWSIFRVLPEQSKDSYSSLYACKTKMSNYQTSTTKI